MIKRLSYTKPVSELSGYKTFVAPWSQGREPRKPRRPVLPIRTEDDTESHDLILAPLYDNKPGPLTDSPSISGLSGETEERKLYRTFGKPGEEYGSPWKDFNQRRTMTSSDLEGAYMADKQQTFQGILEEMKGMSLEEMYEEALRLKEEQGSEWDPVDEEILEKLRLLIKGEFVPEALDEEDWGQDFEEDWSEDVPEESSEENSEEPVLAYKRKVQRQKSHSRMTRLKRWLAQGLLGRLKARKKAKKYRRRLKTQLKTTRKINKYKLRTRIGPKVKSRHRKASEGLTHLDLVRLERHGYVSEDSE